MELQGLLPSSTDFGGSPFSELAPQTKTLVLVPLQFHLGRI